MAAPKKKVAPRKKKAPSKVAPSKSALKRAVKKIIPEIKNTDKQTDRVIRSGKSTRKNAACPECKAFPTITKIRRVNYELRKCRECGHSFEIKG